MKDAFKAGVVRQVVILYRLISVPEMVRVLDYPGNEESLSKRLDEIISLFDPDNAYWYRVPSACLGKFCNLVTLSA